MIPFGSVGGCHSRVTEEAVTFIKVTFRGGPDGSGSPGANFDVRVTFGEKKKLCVVFCQSPARYLR